MLTLSEVTVRLGTRVVLDGASAAIPPKTRVGLVGRNGSGKSTLLKAVAGLGEIDGGAIEMPRGTRVGYIAQEAPGGEISPLEAVLASDAERAQLLGEIEETHDAQRMAEIHDRLEVIDAY